MSAHQYNTLSTEQLAQMLLELGQQAAEAQWEYDCSGCQWADMAIADAEAKIESIEKVLVERGTPESKP